MYVVTAHKLITHIKIDTNNWFQYVLLQKLTIIEAIRTK